MFYKISVKVEDLEWKFGNVYNPVRIAQLMFEQRAREARALGATANITHDNLGAFQGLNVIGSTLSLIVLKDIEHESEPEAGFEHAKDCGFIAKEDAVTIGQPICLPADSGTLSASK